MPKLLVFFLVLMALPGQSATWYVRPLVYGSWNGNTPVVTAGVYGSQNGTAYANAWNGLQSVVWGNGGVNAGDTLYICGTNIARYDSNQSPNTVSYNIWLKQSGVTLRGDYPGDSGFIFGGAVDAQGSYSWSGPDANGVYRTACRGNDSWFFKYQIVAGAPVMLNLATNRTWVGGLGARYGEAYTSNYIKAVDGNAPVITNLAMARLGWNLALTNGTSNIVFHALTFYGGGFSVTPPDFAAGFLGVKNISFTNCTFLQGTENGPWFNPLPGHDNWNIVGCEIAYSKSAIYSYLLNQKRGVHGWHVVGNYLHDFDTVNWPDPDDAHAIGIQAGSSWLIKSNRIERSGAAIDFWTGLSQAQTNNVVAYNFIRDSYVKSITGGGGIVFEGTPGQSNGLAANNFIYGNIILNVGLNATDEWQGGGIDWEQPEFVEIWNNTVVNARQGIQMRNNAGPVRGRVLNNIIVNPVVNFEYIVGDGSHTNLAVDYNLFYTNAPITQPFRIGAVGFTNGTNSTFSDPLFISAFPAVPNDLRPKSGSPATRTGISIGGYTQDFSGSPIPTNRPPDRGAFQSSQLAPPSGLQAVGLP